MWLWTSFRSYYLRELGSGEVWRVSIPTLHSEAEKQTPTSPRRMGTRGLDRQRAEHAADWGRAPTQDSLKGCNLIFPNDVNGDVLRRMEARGDDLTRPRNIDFTVVFADAISADQFAEHFLALGFAVSVRETATEEDFPWDVIVVKHMAPTYDGITDFENLLQSVADGWNGHNDGWGCFSQPNIH